MGGDALAMLVLLCGAASAPSAGADETSTLSELQELKRQLQQLQEKVQRLEEQQKQPSIATGAETNSITGITAGDNKPALATSAQNQGGGGALSSNSMPRIVIGSEGFSMGTADRQFSLQFHGLLQADSRTFINDAGIVGNDTLLIRRLRPIISGTVFHDFEFLFAPDFAPSTGAQLFDAFVNYKPMPEVQFMAGKYKPPFSLEYLQFDQFTMFNERGLPTYLGPGRDVGFTLHGELGGGVFSYAAGIFNGVGDGRRSSNVDFEDNKEFADDAPSSPSNISPAGWTGWE